MAIVVCITVEECEAERSSTDNLISGSTALTACRLLNDADDTQVKNNKIGTDINGQMAIPNAACRRDRSMGLPRPKSL